MNKFFINKPNGTKPSGISKFLIGLVALVSLAVVSQPQTAVQAAPQSYTQSFQDPTTTLSGRSVQTNLYFSTEDYWKLEQATFTFRFQISQLSNRQTSDLTLRLNGVKFASFRPDKSEGIQTKQVKLPLDLIKGTNNLTIAGQIINQSAKNSELVTTPANWLTLQTGSSINFGYQLNEAEPTVSSFYRHFVGMDTISAQRSAIVVPDQANDAELSAASIALAGVARFITTTDGRMPIVPAATAPKDGYQLVVATYDRLPATVAKVVKPTDAGSLTAITSGKTRYLVVAGRTEADLLRAARYVANEELMKQTAKATKAVTKATRTQTSVLQYQGKAQLTEQATLLEGVGQHTSTYFVALPIDRTNSAGSTIKLHLRYAKNLDFARSLVSVKIGSRVIGSATLKANQAGGADLSFAVPKSMPLANTFAVSVVADLVLPGTSASGDAELTPWLSVEPQSTAQIRSKRTDSLLFSNYPSTFVKNQSFDQLVLVRPQTMTDADYSSLTNLVNLLGNYAQNNTGAVKVTATVPSQAELANSSIIAFGSYQTNPFIKRLNKHLYFKFVAGGARIEGNEKLSLESDYGKTVGTAQLLRSPYNQKRGLLVVTGAHPEGAQLASTQLATQAAVHMYKGDALVIDPDNQHYSYRFKKTATLSQPTPVTKAKQNPHLVAYFGLATAVVALIVATGVLVIRKNQVKSNQPGGDQDGQ